MRPLPALVLIGACTFLPACRKAQQQPRKMAETAAVKVDVLRVEPRSFAATVPVTGSLVSRSRVDVKAETVGRVLKFPKEEGDAVRAGEPVVWVDEENYRLAVRQAESAVHVAGAVIERARVMEGHSRSELERAYNLVRSGGITDKELKAAQLAAKEARAQTELGSAQLEQARAALAAAQKRLRDTVIHAPVAGEIQKKFVNPGAYVEAPTPVFSLVDNSRLEVECLVASADLAPIRSGQNVAFMLSSYPGTTFEGRVVEINPAVEAESRSAKVRIRVNNARGKLKAGMFVQGEILTGMQARAIVVPAAAVYRDDHAAKEAFVLVVENGKAARRTVRIGRERDSLLEILSGLRPGDLLIAEQSIEIAEGVRVEPQTPGDGSAR